MKERKKNEWNNSAGLIVTATTTTTRNIKRFVMYHPGWSYKIIHIGITQLSLDQIEIWLRPWNYLYYKCKHTNENGIPTERKKKYLC